MAAKLDGEAKQSLAVSVCSLIMAIPVRAPASDRPDLRQGNLSFP